MLSCSILFSYAQLNSFCCLFCSTSRTKRLVVQKPWQTCFQQHVLFAAASAASILVATDYWLDLAIFSTWFCLHSKEKRILLHALLSPFCCRCHSVHNNTYHQPIHCRCVGAVRVRWNSCEAAALFAMAADGFVHSELKSMSTASHSYKNGGGEVL